jgi:parallel beta-helix repeat protein
VWNNRYGISLWNSNYNVITSNNVNSNLGYGLYLASSNNSRIAGNAFTNDCLFVESSYQNDVRGNIVNGKPLIYLENITNSSVIYAGQVVLVNCDNITVKNLNISGVEVGVELWNTTSSSIVNNIISKCSDGINLYLSSKNRITSNKITDNSIGIRLWQSNNNEITYNNFFDNQYGISLRVYNYGNLIFLNDFKNVYNIDSLDSNNFWNSKEPITYRYNNSAFTNYMGNYWNDYTGFDTNSDGIGDTPYSINSDKDNFPLMQPFEKYVQKIKGDFDGNGIVDASDVTYVAYILVGKNKADLSADFNGNGRVDIGDLAKIAYYFLGRIDTL